MTNIDAQATRKLKSFIKNSQQKMLVEYKAINEHLASFKEFKQVIMNFDGKVIGKRFETALKEVATTHVYLEIKSYGTYVTSLTNISESFGDKYSVRPERYREVSFRISYIEGTSNRLDAKKTIQDFSEVVESMKGSRISLDVSEIYLVEKYEQLMKIEDEIKNLFNGCNYVVSEQLKQHSTRLK